MSETKKITIEISLSASKALKLLAIQKECPVNQVISEIVERCVVKNKAILSIADIDI